MTCACAELDAAKTAQADARQVCERQVQGTLGIPQHARRGGQHAGYRERYDRPFGDCARIAEAGCAAGLVTLDQRHAVTTHGELVRDARADDARADHCT